MPIVFIHGVNVRQDEKYKRETRQRNEYLANILFPLIGRKTTAESIINPFWGDLATNLTPGNLFIPERPKLAIEKLSETVLGKSDSLVTRLSASEFSLLKLARKRPITEVFDAMVAASVEEDVLAEPESVSRLSLSLLRFGRRFQTLEEQLDWLEGMHSDVELLDRIEQEIEKEEGTMGWLRTSYGNVRQRTRARLKNAGQRLRSNVSAMRMRARTSLKKVASSTRDAATTVGANTVTQPLRKLFHNHMFYFIGDAFLYFGQRGTAENPGPIIQRVSAAIAEARSLVSDDDPDVVVIAHSMGGNIICDFASHFEQDTPIDLLITVGAQFPLFADLSMFPGLGEHRPFAKPPGVKRWINIYDSNDVFAFAAQPLFSGVEDRPYASGKMGITTHADCFKFISLYEHIARAIVPPLHVR